MNAVPKSIIDNLSHMDNLVKVDFKNRSKINSRGNKLSDEFGKDIAKREKSELVDRKSVEEKRSEICRLITEGSTTDDLLVTKQKYDEVHSLILEVVNDYYDELSIYEREELELDADYAKGFGNFSEALHIINEGTVANEFTVKLEKYATGLELIAQTIEEYWRVFEQQIKIQEDFKSLVISLVEFESEAKLENWDGQPEIFIKNTRMLRRAAGFLLWTLEQNTQERGEQLEKNQRLRAWLRSRLDNKGMSEEEIREGKERFELLKKVIDDSREEGHKIFS